MRTLRTIITLFTCVACFCVTGLARAQQAQPEAAPVQRLPPSWTLSPSHAGPWVPQLDTRTPEQLYRRGRQQVIGGSVLTVVSFGFIVLGAVSFVHASNARVDGFLGSLDRDLSIFAGVFSTAAAAGTGVGGAFLIRAGLRKMARAELAPAPAGSLGASLRWSF